MSNDMGVWVFNGSGRRYPNLPSALFLSRQDAEKWIGQYSVSGLLTRYPLNTSVYDWAIEQEFFRPSKKQHTESQFIENFSSAHLEHYHYESGQPLFSDFE